jgi:hypothetical protein
MSDFYTVINQCETYDPTTILFKRAPLISSREITLIANRNRGIVCAMFAYILFVGCNVCVTFAFLRIIKKG